MAEVVLGKKRPREESFDEGTEDTGLRNRENVEKEEDEGLKSRENVEKEVKLNEESAEYKAESEDRSVEENNQTKVETSVTLKQEKELHDGPEDKGTDSNSKDAENSCKDVGSAETVPKPSDKSPNLSESENRNISRDRDLEQERDRLESDDKTNGSIYRAKDKRDRERERERERDRPGSQRDSRSYYEDKRGYHSGDRRSPSRGDKPFGREKCYSCGKIGHFARECPRKPSRDECFYCHRRGHRKYECTQKLMDERGGGFPMDNYWRRRDDRLSPEYSNRSSSQFYPRFDRERIDRERDWEWEQREREYQRWDRSFSRRGLEDPHSRYDISPVTYPPDWHRGNGYDSRDNLSYPLPYPTMGSYPDPVANPVPMEQVPANWHMQGPPVINTVIGDRGRYPDGQIYDERMFLPEGEMVYMREDFNRVPPSDPRVETYHPPVEPIQPGYADVPPSHAPLADPRVLYSMDRNRRPKH